jgi:hypothetical protein
MDANERQEKIDLYGRAYEILVGALAQFPREMWDYRTAPGEWTVREIAAHILDAEINGYIRARKGVAEPGSPVAAYDGARWAEALRYGEENVEEAADLFRWLRRRTYRLIRSLPEEAWANTFEHPENGTMTLDDWLDVYSGHIPEHVEQMWAVYSAWMKEKD